MHFKGLLCSFLAALTICLFPANVRAYALIEMPAAEQFAEADFVVIATVGPKKSCEFQDFDWLCARLIPKLVLKKSDRISSPENVNLMLQSSIAEASIAHFDLNGDFLIYMRCFTEEYCEPLLGYRSVFLLKSPALQ